MQRSTFLKLLGIMAMSKPTTLLNAMAKELKPSPKMPVLFLGHGSPMNAIEENEFVTGFRNIATKIPTPQAILCISAHWETKGTFVTGNLNPKMIYDFGGFPAALSQVNYAAPGSEQLCIAVAENIVTTTVTKSYDWGLDHGCWSVVKHLYPNANIPLVEMSIDYTQPLSYHYALAKQLQQLRNKGVLIIGSGNIVHNLGAIAWDKFNEPNYGLDWAIEARTITNKLIIEGNHQALCSYKELGKAVQLAIPSPEHFTPLIYTLALQNKEDKLFLFNDKYVAGSLTMTSLYIA